MKTISSTWGEWFTVDGIVRHCTRINITGGEGTTRFAAYRSGSMTSGGQSIWRIAEESSGLWKTTAKVTSALPAGTMLDDFVRRMTHV